MPRFRQSNLPLPAVPARALSSSRSTGVRAFTLIELIFVLALLAISASLIVAQMGSFVRGRNVNFEARRMLSLTQYGQSRAVSEGVPVVLWVNVKDNTYGLSVQSSFTNDEGDQHATSYAAEPSLTLEAAADPNAVVSEDDDEKLGLPEGIVAIRFNPDGFIDESSVQKIVIRQGADVALALVPTPNRLAYEITPVTPLN